MDPVVSHLLAAQEGVVSRAQLVPRGVPPAVLAASVRDGGLVRIRPGLFADPARWVGAHPDERYRLTVRGVLLGRPGWAASHHAALALWRLPLWRTDLRVVDVLAGTHTAKIRPGTHVHVQGNVTAAVRDGCATAGPAVAAVQVAATAGAESGVVALDAALHRGLCTTDEVERVLAAGVVRYGTGRARRMLALADPACESVGETRTRLLLLALGHRPRSQVVIRDAHGVVGRVDLLVGRVVVEFDGALKYGGAEGRDALVAEKVREDRLRALGYVVVRLTWADLDHPARVAALVQRALAVAA
ncbi:type IV toxin-antitoxin system AbiEi family antitoxin domain-containing protein [Phycicoccus sp. HDW14]|uniref:type IV toxin-antitoxin system AbiEi family antitoxin domain-containing protein n=1 Tax=Phycicoccus sp. HDW14 TaxID=2714941 RepID=UPI00140D11CF|nr:type IV toxin-antitoxin system AbiEi family antitoxin domain-containing protein [Phycicoccus sp. HDW14]QIM21307.1 type IV toxin-antitoxin system AbiEi family antitoxin domain-containing protein [Phycicoccus sp. HDW14]